MAVEEAEVGFSVDIGLWEGDEHMMLLTGFPWVLDSIPRNGVFDN